MTDKIQKFQSQKTKDIHRAVQPLNFMLFNLSKKLADNQKQSFVMFVLISPAQFRCSTANQIQSCVVLAMNHIKAYCQKSSIDGISYVVRRDLRLVEKVRRGITVAQNRFWA
jgi:hypothetical protein